MQRRSRWCAQNSVPALWDSYASSALPCLSPDALAVLPVCCSTVEVVMVLQE